MIYFTRIEKSVYKKLDSGANSKEIVASLSNDYKEIEIMHTIKSVQTDLLADAMTYMIHRSSHRGRNMLVI